MSKSLYELCKYDFSADELRVLGLQLAREAEDAIALKGEREASMAGFAAALKQSAKRVAEISHKLNCGYEMRDVECVVLLDVPQPGIKTITRIDTGARIREEIMTDDERQGALFPDGGRP